MSFAGEASPPARSAARILARGLLLPAVAGAATVVGFAPFYWWPVTVVALAVLFRVWDTSGSPLQAALSGFAFGLGMFLAGVSWVFVSMHVYGAMPVALAAVATFLFCAYLAIFPALAGWLALRIARDATCRRLAAIPAAFVAFEWLRGVLFTGFPWLTLGASQTPSSPLAGFAPLLGGYGVSLAAALVAAILAALVASAPWSRGRHALLAGLATLLIVGGVLKAVPFTEPVGKPVSVALLQGNVAQHLKWRDEVRTKTFTDYARMAQEARAQIVVLPETALPAFFDRLPPRYLDGLRDHAREAGKDILLGTVERKFEGEKYQYFNSLVKIGRAGPDESYRKRHLVPFGEFIPWGFDWVLKVLKIPLTDFGRGDARQAPITAAGVAIGVAICYEDIFGSEVIDHLPRAQLLLNVTNDAWFGESFAAEQHLQASQLRALEAGRWMLRSTNTGVTAAIDERGYVVAKLPQFTSGTLLTEAVPREGLTPYARMGDLAVLFIVAALLVAAFLKGFHKR
ncbi:apolipoprotein N-acyltransferase [Usitatibacter palustris]|uniref:Apolipoprotein N-acyltransferase n=1 Tax=Usitatibacter palustris TaxID=2732487 RepID=A0A6M4H299_9PROT|nr:Apolipoprotein N-acyltransferase [Usitatibacter palustris]